MRDIPGYEKLYAATEDGEIFSYRSQKFLKQSKDGCGYSKVILYKDGTRKTCKVHRLIALTYLENPLNLPCVNHKDECKTNNCVENLEFCDAKYNNNYGTRNERAAKSLQKKVQCIETEEIYESLKEAAKSNFISVSHLSNHLVGRRKSAGGLHWRYYEEQEN